MRFDLTDMRLFLTVIERGSITAGAQAMHLGLASASERIGGMEAALVLKLFEMLTEEQADAFRDARIHVDIGRQAPPWPGCTTHTLLDERVMAVLASDHPLSARDAVRVDELADSPLIVYPKHPAAQFPHFIASLCRDAGVTPNVAHEAYEIQTAIALVAVGLGVTYVGESVVLHGRADVVYRHFTEPGAAQITSLTASFWTGDTSPHLHAFLACLPQAAHDDRDSA